MEWACLTAKAYQLTAIQPNTASSSPDNVVATPSVKPEAWIFMRMASNRGFLRIHASPSCMRLQLAQAAQLQCNLINWEGELTYLHL
jgi:hypothetical protein